MPGSLIDFGDIAQRAQQQVQNAIGMQHLALQQEQMGLHARQTAVNEQQLAVNQQSEQTARVNSLRMLLDHPIVQNNPDMQDHIFASVAPQLGIPTAGLVDKLTQSRQDRMDLMRATLDNDPKKASDAIVKLTAGLNPEDAAKALKNYESLPLLRGKVQIAQQTMEMNEAKFSELRQNQAIVNEGRGPLTALSSIMRDQLRGTDTPQFKAMQTIFGQTGHSGLLSSTDKTFGDKGKEPFKHLLDGNSAQLAQNLQPEIDRVQYLMQTDQRALEDMDHGVQQPGQMREALTARIATNGPILGALRDMQDWYKDPLNKDKHAAAQSAYKAIEGRRVELESMNKKLDSQRQNLVNLANEKFDYKQSQDSGLAEAQRRFLALPEKQQNAAAAGKISQAIKDELGVEVLPESIYKNPNKPLVSLDVNTAQTASTEAAKDFMKETRQTYNQLKQAPALLNNIEKAKALIPSAKGFMGPGGDSLLEAAKFLNNRMGAKIDVAGVKSTEELRTRIFFNIMDNLKKMDAQPSEMQQKIMMDALGKIGTDPQALPAVLDAFGDTLREKIDLHNQEVAGAKKNGTRFPYDPTISIPQKSTTPAGASAGAGKAQPQGQAQPQSGAVLKSLPQGAKQIGTYQGKPVYQSPDGKKWMGE